MSTPDWLSEGATLRDQDGERWVIRSVGIKWVALGHTTRGEHKLLRSDLVDWVENGDWTTAQ